MSHAYSIYKNIAQIREIIISWYNSFESKAIKWEIHHIINWFVFKYRTRKEMEFSFICPQHYYTIGIYLLVHIGVLIFMSEVQGRFFILRYRHKVHERLRRNTKSVEWKVYTFSVSFCISMMTPGPFISCIGNIILLDLHMKGQHSFFNKKGTFFNFKELKWWTELLIGFVITHEKHRSDTVIQTQSNFFKIMASLISSDVKGHA